MSAAEATLEMARAQLKIYEEKSESEGESWKADHDAAMRCLDFEGLLAYGLSLVRFIDQLDTAWRTKVFRNELPYDADMEKAIECLYRWWVRPCDRVTKRLEDFERQGFVVSGAGDFHKACREVRGILTPDEEFFAGNDALVREQDDALEELRRGETVELKELSD